MNPPQELYQKVLISDTLGVLYCDHIEMYHHYEIVEYFEFSMEFKQVKGYFDPYQKSISVRFSVGELEHFYPALRKEIGQYVVFPIDYLKNKAIKAIYL